MVDAGVTRRRAIVTAGVALLSSCAWARQAHDDGNKARLRALLDAAAAGEERLLPLSVTRRAPPFVDPLSDDYATTLHGLSQHDADSLAAIDRGALSLTDRIAYDVLLYRTRQKLTFLRSGNFETARHAPLDPSFGLHVEFPDFVSGTAQFATRDDYEVGLARLEGFAGYLDSTLLRLREGLAAGQVQPVVVVTNVLRQVDVMLALPVEKTPFYSAVLRMPFEIAASAGDRLAQGYRRMVTDRILPGYRSWKSYLADTYLPRATEAPGRWAMKGGSGLYDAELAQHTTTIASPEAIHRVGLAQVQGIREQMEQTRRLIGFDSPLEALFNFIRTAPQFYCKTPEELLDRFKGIQERIWQGMPRQFARRPRAPFSVQPLPSLAEERGTGYYRPGAIETGSPGILFFNMAMLGTRPIPTLETLILHEGIPGHHFQINLARENTKLPSLLRFAPDGTFTAYTEGWGLYSESLGRDLGLYTDPYQWFGHLDMAMLRAVRLVIDTGIHAQRWDRQRAIDYMLSNTSMAAHDVAVEIDRYIAAPGQACAYKMGELKLHSLRERATAALGSRFDVKDFHDQVLGTGALPLQVLEDKISGWIRAGGGSAGSGFV